MDILSGIAGIAGPIIDRNWAKRDTEDANNFSFQSQGRAMEFNSAEAIANRNWQKEMSDTSWQRGTADMMAAGINPMLSFMKGGASTPSGGQGSSTPQTGATTRGSNFNPLDNLATAAQIENIHAQTEKVKAETPTIRNQARVQDATVDNLKEQTEQLKRQGTLTDEQVNQVKQAIENMKREWQNLGTQGVKMEEETVLTMLRQQLTKLDINAQKIQNVLRLLDVPLALNEANAQQSAWMRHISPFLGDAGKVMGSASQIREAFRKRDRRTGSSSIEDTMTPQGIRRKTTTREDHYGD